MKIERICQQCGGSFLAKESQVRLGHAKFCSKKCFYQFFSRKVKVKCQWCGKRFFTTPHRVKVGRGKFCSLACRANARRGSIASNETRLRMSLSHMGKTHTEEAKTKMSKALKGKTPSIEHRQKLSDTLQGHHTSVEARKRMSEAHKKSHSKTEFKKGEHPSLQTEAKRGQRLSPKTEIKMGQHLSKATEFTSERAKEMWQDPAFKERTLKAILSSSYKRPTKPEMQLEVILNKHLPEFKYNGDGRLGVTLGGLTPDFVNIDGRKDLIEVFGDYYHSPEFLEFRWQGSELGKIMVYNSLGWKCLVIWEYELKELTEEQIVDKIKTFQMLAPLKRR